MRQLNPHPRVPVNLNYFQTLTQDIEAALSVSVPTGTLIRPFRLDRTQLQAQRVAVRTASGSSETLTIYRTAPLEDTLLMTRLGLAEVRPVSRLTLPLQEVRPGLLSDPVVPTTLVGSSALINQGLYDYVTVDGTVQPSVRHYSDRGNLRLLLDDVTLYHKTPLPDRGVESAGSLTGEAQTTELWRERFACVDGPEIFSLEFSMPNLAQEELLMVEVQGTSNRGLGLVQLLYAVSSLDAAPVTMQQIGTGRYAVHLNKSLLAKAGLSDFSSSYLRIFSARVTRTFSTTSRLQGVFDLDVPVKPGARDMDVYLLSDTTGEVIDLRDALAANPQLLNVTASGQLVLRLQTLEDVSLLQRIDLSGTWRVCVSRVPVTLTDLIRKVQDRLTSTEGMLEVHGVPGVRRLTPFDPARSLYVTATPRWEKDDYHMVYAATGRHLVVPRINVLNAQIALKEKVDAGDVVLGAATPTSDSGFAFAPLVDRLSARVLAAPIMVQTGDVILALVSTQGTPTHLWVNGAPQALSELGAQTYATYQGQSVTLLTLAVDDLLRDKGPEAYFKSVQISVGDARNSFSGVTAHVR